MTQGMKITQTALILKSKSLEGLVGILYILPAKAENNIIKTQEKHKHRPICITLLEPFGHAEIWPWSSGWVTSIRCSDETRRLSVGIQ